MALESLRARLGLGGRQRKFVDLETVRDLEDISDPETTADESSVSVREWAFTHPGYAVILVLATLLGGGLVLRWSARLAVGVATNPWTYATIGAATVLGLTYRRGWRKRDDQVTDYDELVLKSGNNATAFKGRYIELSGRADAFVPIKGWSGFFNSPRTYQNGEIAAGMDVSFDPWELNEKEAAVIRLEPGENGTLVGISRSEWGGLKVTQETSGVEPDPGGNYTSLRCTMPEFGDQRADALREQNEQLRVDLRDAREEADALQRRNRNLKERMNEPIEEAVDERIDQFERLRNAGDGRRGRGSQSSIDPQPRDYRGNGSMDTDAELQQVEEELSDDDE